MTDPGNTLDIVPVESQSSALVATAKSSNSDILALALALTQQQDLRRRRDDFEVRNVDDGASTYFPCSADTGGRPVL